MELVWYFSERGYHVNAMGTEQRLHDTQSKAVQALLVKPVKPVAGGIVLGFPTLVEKYYSPLVTAGPYVFVTMFESTQLPKNWVQALNRAHAVVVPSRNQEKIFASNGVMRLHVNPLGVSPTFFELNRRGQPVGRPERGPVTEEKPYTFLCWGDRGERKGWADAVQAFYQAFGDRKDVRLIIKARHDSFAYNITNPNINALRGDLDELEMRDLYRSVDCMVFPSHGEGFGLPPREFAATGGPAIVNEWWADDALQWGYPVRYTMTRGYAGHPRFDGLGKWATVDIDHLAEQMTYQREVKPAIAAYMGKRSATRVQKLYAWDKFAGRMAELWEHVSRPRSVPVSDRRRRRASNN